MCSDSEVLIRIANEREGRVQEEACEAVGDARPVTLTEHHRRRLARLEPAWKAAPRLPRVAPPRCRARMPVQRRRESHGARRSATSRRSRRTQAGSDDSASEPEPPVGGSPPRRPAALTRPRRAADDAIARRLATLRAFSERRGGPTVRAVTVAAGGRLGGQAGTAP